MCAVLIAGGRVLLFAPQVFDLEPMGLFMRTREEQAEINIGTTSKGSSGAHRACGTWLSVYICIRSPWFSYSLKEFPV